LTKVFLTFGIRTFVYNNDVLGLASSSNTKYLQIQIVLNPHKNDVFQDATSTWPKTFNTLHLLWWLAFITPINKTDHLFQRIYIQLGLKLFGYIQVGVFCSIFVIFLGGTIGHL
jgi:hypothetical protein